MTNKVKVLLASLLLTTGCAALYMGSRSQSGERPESNSEYARTSVSIVSPTLHAGGSGVILWSRASKSAILTNLHVCNLIQVGGVVQREGQSWPVMSYRVYTKHDLCVVTVAANLRVNTHVAEDPPDLYSNLVVAGHPALLPTIMSRGHFSSHKIIQMIVDMIPCDGTEEGQDMMFCMFMGAKPIVQQFDSQPISALIMPGSSGSGVFNDKGEIAGLVFAGPGDGLGYGFIVPQEYIADFLDNLNFYPEQQPKATDKPKNFFTALQAFKRSCRENEEFASVCKRTKIQSIIGL